MSGRGKRRRRRSHNSNSNTEPVVRRSKRLQEKREFKEQQRINESKEESTRDEKFENKIKELFGAETTDEEIDDEQEMEEKSESEMNVLQELENLENEKLKEELKKLRKFVRITRPIIQNSIQPFYDRILFPEYPNNIRSCAMERYYTLVMISEKKYRIIANKDCISSNKTVFKYRMLNTTDEYDKYRKSFLKFYRLNSKQYMMDMNDVNPRVFMGVNMNGDYAYESLLDIIYLYGYGGSIDDNHQRKGVYAKKEIAAFVCIGEYRGVQYLPSEYRKIYQFTNAEYLHNKNIHRISFDFKNEEWPEYLDLEENMNMDDNGNYNNINGNENKIEDEFDEELEFNSISNALQKNPEIILDPIAFEEQYLNGNGGKVHLFRYINGGRSMNGMIGCKFNCILVEVLQKNWPHLYVCTVRDINVGEELCINYGQKNYGVVGNELGFHKTVQCWIHQIIKNIEE